MNASDQRLVRCIAWFSGEDDMTEEEIWEQQQMRKAEERRQEDAEMEQLEQERLARAERSPALTDEEREAILFFLKKHRKIQSEGENYCCLEASPHADAIQGLLERLD